MQSQWSFKTYNKISSIVTSNTMIAGPYRTKSWWSEQDNLAEQWHRRKTMIGEEEIVEQRDRMARDCRD